MRAQKKENEMQKSFSNMKIKPFFPKQEKNNSTKDFFLLEGEEENKNEEKEESI